MYFKDLPCSSVKLAISSFKEFAQNLKPVPYSAMRAPIVFSAFAISVLFADIIQPKAVFAHYMVINLLHTSLP